MTEKRFTVPLKYSLSHSKIQCDGKPLTNNELVRILNTNEGAFLENFNLKEEKKELQLQCNLLREQANEFHRIARENANRVGELEEENKQLKGEVKRFKCINKQLEERLDKDIALNMDCVEAIEEWENECQGVIEQIKYKLKLEKIGDVE